MTGSLRAIARDARYALPKQLERVLSGPDAADAVRYCRRLDRRGLAATIGYFQSSSASPDEIEVAMSDITERLGESRVDCYLSVKAPPLRFERPRLQRLAARAAAADVPLMFDAHALKDADDTITLASDLLTDFPGTGVALPARWHRSRSDAALFRDTTARIRIVKGEWADPAFVDENVAANYLALACELAGRPAPVAIATHDPELAERALSLLLAAGTPCELEQLRGLPRRRTCAVAERLGVAVRVYVPFGPGWWPYAVDKALARPYLLSWMIRDRLSQPSRR